MAGLNTPSATRTVHSSSTPGPPGRSNGSHLPSSTLQNVSPAHSSALVHGVSTALSTHVAPCTHDVSASTQQSAPHSVSPSAQTGTTTAHSLSAALHASSAAQHTVPHAVSPASSSQSGGGGAG